MTKLVSFIIILLVVVFMPSAWSAYTDNGDGSVTDTSTGLTWMRCALGQDWSGSTCTGTASGLSMPLSVVLPPATAGQSVWRLPNVRELLTIVDRSKARPAIDPVAFPNAPTGGFCTSTAAGVVNWGISFDDGSADTTCDNTFIGNQHVRLVRGGQSLALLSDARPSTDYIDNGNGTLTHKPTGLMWKRCAEGQGWTGSGCSGSAEYYIWPDALAAASSFAGKNDWRLPTQDELLSLVDYAGQPAINGSLFPGLGVDPLSSSFWSASEYLGDALGNGWSVDFSNGASSVSSSLSYDPVLLVRGGSSVNTVAAPSAPIVGLASPGNGGVTVNFTAPIYDGGAAITGYTATCGGNMASASASPITVSGLSNGSIYSCAVSAINAAGQGLASGASNSVISGSPLAPTSVNATAGSSQATVSFVTPASDNGAPISRYSVVSSPDSITASGPVSPITVSGLRGGVNYTFTVKATNSLGDGPWSGASNSVTPSDGSVNLINNPDFEAGNDGSWGQVTLGSALPITNDATAAHEGSWFAWLGGYPSASDTIFQDLTIPLNVQTAYVQFWYQVASDGTIAGKVQDTLSVDLYNPASGTRMLNIKTLSNLDVAPDWLQSSQVDLSAYKGQTLRLKFTATTSNASATGFYVDNVALRVITTVLPPGPPTGVSATAGSSQATVSFTAPSSDGGAAISGYTVTASPGGYSATGTASPITVTGLANGSTYTFSVSAINSAGNGLSSAASNAVVPKGPSLQLSSGALNFGNVPVANSVAKTLILSNTGNGVLTLGGITATGDFGQSNACGSSLAGGSSCGISVTFTPTLPGNRTGGLSIASNVGTQTLSLTGAGVAPVGSAVTANLVAGWNLLGNGGASSVSVASAFGDQGKVATVWKWVTGANPHWAFYSPELAGGGTAYAASKGYSLLTSLEPGEGFWVNAKVAFSVDLGSGGLVTTKHFADGVTTNNLPSGWSLIAVGDNPSPRDFVNGVSLIPPAAPALAAESVLSLWAWFPGSAVSAPGWFFYAPSLDNSNGLKAYTSGKAYLDFSTANKALDATTGFWVNHP